MKIDFDTRSFIAGLLDALFILLFISGAQKGDMSIMLWGIFFGVLGLRIYIMDLYYRLKGEDAKPPEP